MQRPRTLRLVKNDDVLGWRSGVDQHVIAEMMHVLNESFDTLSDFALPQMKTATSLTSQFVAREGFAQHCNERTIPNAE